MIFKFAFLLSLVRFNLFHVFLFIDISSFEMCSYIPLSIFPLGRGQEIFVFLLPHIHFNNSTSSAQNKFWVNILCLKFFTLRHAFHINETIFNVLINHWRQFSSSGQSKNYENETMNIQFSYQLVFCLHNKVNLRCNSASELRGEVYNFKACGHSSSNLKLQWIVPLAPTPQQ